MLPFFGMTIDNHHKSSSKKVKNHMVSIAFFKKAIIILGND